MEKKTEGEGTKVKTDDKTVDLDGENGGNDDDDDEDENAAPSKTAPKLASLWRVPRAKRALEAAAVK